MLKPLTQDQLLAVAGGCGDDTCKDVTLQFLHTCTMEEMMRINQIFKNILLGADMKEADNNTKIAALIAAIQNSSL